MPRKAPCPHMEPRAQAKKALQPLLDHLRVATIAESQEEIIRLIAQNPPHSNLAEIVRFHTFWIAWVASLIGTSPE